MTGILLFYFRDLLLDNGIDRERQFAESSQGVDLMISIEY